MEARGVRGEKLPECLLCHAPSDAARGRDAGGRLLGPLTVGKDAGAWVHEWCCLFAPCARFVRGYEAGPDSEPLQPADIDCAALQKERKRASRLRCSICKRPGAVIGCYICSRKCYHYPCAASTVQYLVCAVCPRKCTLMWAFGAAG